MPSTEPLSIRHARRGDVPVLVLLWAAMMEENARLDPRLAMHPHAREHMAEQFAAWVQDPHRLVVVAEEGRLPVGYAAASVGPGSGTHRPETVGQVTDCFVAPPKRRRGIARRLAGVIRENLYARGVSVLRLQVAAQNTDSMAFWRAQGFEPLEVVLERDATG